MATATNILIVEDDRDDVYLLTRQLQQAQIDDHVTWFSSGSDALTFLEQAEAPPLAIFLDLNLPGLNGMEVLEKIKDDRRLRSVPVIIMTGSINPSDLKRCRQLGAKDILAKPITLSSFIKTVAHIFPAIPESKR